MASGKADRIETGTERIARAQAAMAAVFAASRYVPVDPPVIQPAGVFLDRSGESIRRRMFVFTDPEGNELCLRPDLTIPTCRLYLEREPAARKSARFSYGGLAFRHAAEGTQKAREFPQAGVEFYGGRDRVAADAEVFGQAVAALEACGVGQFDIRMGDLGLFSALVDALDIPEAWRGRLKRHFWRPHYFEDLLDQLSRAAGVNGDSASRRSLLAAMEALDPGQARGFIEELLELAGIAPEGGRSVGEIAERFLEQAAETSARLPRSTVNLINRFLALSGPPRRILGRIRGLAKSAKLSIDAPLDSLERRLDLIEGRGIPLSGATFSPGFGRDMEYYTGFVFDLTQQKLGDNGQLAGGGRYDNLLRDLGAPRAVPAVGCMLRPDRVLMARGGKR